MRLVRSLTPIRFFIIHKISDSMTHVLLFMDKDVNQAFAKDEGCVEKNDSKGDQGKLTLVKLSQCHLNSLPNFSVQSAIQTLLCNTDENTRKQPQRTAKGKYFSVHLKFAATIYMAHVHLFSNFYYRYWT